MKTVLVIEDEPQIRTNILKILGFKGFQAIGAEDGEKGIEMANQHSPDLIICDIMLPNVDGYGVLSALRQSSNTVTIPFIFLSAKSDRSDIRQGMNLGADDYLTKPFTAVELIDTITSRLEKQATVSQPYIDAMRQATQQLNQFVYFDPLTNLPNRVLLRNRLQEAIVQAQKHSRWLRFCAST
ncbi:MAG: response regulator [Cyanobacteria bacterium CRU_2_1]|nr:response regulator [Cyanobacteria bacterium CRU_2_1]